MTWPLAVLIRRVCLMGSGSMSFLKAGGMRGCSVVRCARRLRSVVGYGSRRARRLRSVVGCGGRGCLVVLGVREKGSGSG